MVTKLLLAALPVTCSIAAAAAGESSLKDAFQKDFLIGSALGPLPSYSGREIALIKSQFNCATPEVCMKPRPIHPKEDVWTFAQADAYVNFCEQNNIAAFGHTLVWHQDCPDWFFKDGDKPASRELVLKRIENHIRTILTRYKGRIRGWDMANEAISDNPKEFFRKTKWLEAIDQFHALGLNVMITEVDMDCLPRKPPAGAALAEPKPASPDLLKRQADQYARLFAILHKHRDAITRVTFWGIDDAHTWLNGWPY